MIELNGKKFAKNDKEFKITVNCAGFYKVNKNSINIFNTDKQKVGVINCQGTLVSATKLEDGQYWYTPTTIAEIGNYENYTKSVEEPMEILERFGIRPIN